tara:strand:+ start:18877 stop:20967 length:2091 start_codon:yes stop_codon:yes gene_type:complete
MARNQTYQQFCVSSSKTPVTYTEDFVYDDSYYKNLLNYKNIKFNSDKTTNHHGHFSHIPFVPIGNVINNQNNIQFLSNTFADGDFAKEPVCDYSQSNGSGDVWPLFKNNAFYKGSEISSPNDEKYNFNPGEDFTITFKMYLPSMEHTNIISKGQLSPTPITFSWPQLSWQDNEAPYWPAFRQYIISKSTTKTIVGPPQTTTTGVPLNTNATGTTQQQNVPAESQFPFEVYLDRKGYDANGKSHWAGGVPGYDTTQWGESGSYDPLGYLHPGTKKEDQGWLGRSAKGIDLVFRRSDGDKEAAAVVHFPWDRDFAENKTHSIHNPIESAQPTIFNRWYTVVCRYKDFKLDIWLDGYNPTLQTPVAIDNNIFGQRGGGGGGCYDYIANEEHSNGNHDINTTESIAHPIWLSGNDECFGPTQNNANLYIGSRGGIGSTDHTGINCEGDSLCDALQIEKPLSASNMTHNPAHYLERNGNHFTGKLAELSIYSYGLSDADIMFISTWGYGAPSGKVGNIYYSQGIATITDPTKLSSLYNTTTGSNHNISKNTAGSEKREWGDIFLFNSINTFTGEPQPYHVKSKIEDTTNHVVRFQGTLPLYENEYQCTIDEQEYNYTTNISQRKIPNESCQELKLFDKSLQNSYLSGSCPVTSSEGFGTRPYITTIGLYNENYELLMVGKLGQPVRVSDETDTTFIMRWDS